MSINQRFSDLLHSKKISGLRFAEITGMNHRTVNNIENGATKYPKADFFSAIAKHFPDVNFRWLLLGEGEMYHDGERITVVREPSAEYTSAGEVVQELKDTLADMAVEKRRLEKTVKEVSAYLRSLEPAMEQEGGLPPGEQGRYKSELLALLDRIENR